MDAWRSCAVLSVVAWLLSAVVAGAAAEISPEDLAHFESKVRPLLVERCYECHGAKAQKGGLRLDSKSGWQHGGDHGLALVPGQPGTSLLIKAIARTDPDLQMPPKTPLSTAEIAILTDWVQRGAPDPRTTAPGPAATRILSPEEGRRLWAFQPLRRGQSAPAVPIVRDEGWVRNDIDRFLLARLEERGLRPAPSVDRRRWIRRATLDLIGLPPAPEEIASFLADPASDAEAQGRVLDRLLQSPHYGERWGRHWLDLARWAESAGYENDNDRPHAWPYRDFVIRALNDDLPYDTFVRWQIAGDLLAPSNPMAIKATGFLAAGPMNGQVTEREAEKERYDVLDDWVNTIGTSMLGLTLGCARCHDHKFDPIPSRDYYGLAAALGRTVRINRSLVTDPLTAGHEAWERAHERLLDARRRRAGELAAPSGTDVRVSPPLWVICTPDSITPRGDQAAVTTRFIQRADGASLLESANGEIAGYKIEFHTLLSGIRAVRLEVLPDESLPNFGPGLGDFGEFQMNAFELAVTPAAGGPPVRVALPVSRDTGRRIQGGSWRVPTDAHRPHSALFELKEPAGCATGTVFQVTMRFDGDNPAGRKAIGCFRISVAAGDAVPEHDGPEMTHTAFTAALAAGARRPEQRSAEEQAAWRELQWRSDAEWRYLDLAVRSIEAAKPWPSADLALVVTDAPDVIPQRLKVQGPDYYEKTYLLRRGNPELKQDEMKPAFLQVLARGETLRDGGIDSGAHSTSPRLALARWITDVEAGAGALLARVIVNRLWQHHLGRGLVATPSDFGVQGEPPTHPELLDWLAAELVARGWSLKAMHRLIMTSATYALGLDTSPDQQRLDPENRLWSRRPLRRLESEVLRDSMLAVSGRLDRSLYGAGSLDESVPRRSIYLKVKRSQLIPSLTQLGWPDTLTGLGRRPITTVAPQALLLLNGPHVRTAAEAFARELQPAFARSAADGIAAAYQRALGRDPLPAETEAARQFLKEQAEGYPKATATQTALADFCQTLFSLNEFFYSP